jgi:hypothetical protein
MKTEKTTIKVSPNTLRMLKIMKAEQDYENYDTLIASALKDFKSE